MPDSETTAKKKKKRKSVYEKMNEAFGTMDAEQEAAAKRARQLSGQEAMSTPPPPDPEERPRRRRRTMADLLSEVAEHGEQEQVQNQTKTGSRLGSKTAPDSVADSVANALDSVANDSDSVATREQTAQNGLRLGSKTATDSVANRAKSAKASPRRVTQKKKRPPDSVANRTDSVAKQPNATESKPESLPSYPPDSVAKQADSVANEPDSVATREQKTEIATESKPVSLPSQNRSKSTDSVAIQTPESVAKEQPVLPRSQHQLRILEYLMALQINNGSTTTPMLSRIQLARAVGIDKGTLKNAIDRLVQKGLITRTTYSNACNKGGTVYSVDGSLRRFLIRRWNPPGSDSVAIQNTDSVAFEISDSVANGDFDSVANSLVKLRLSTNLTDQNSGEANPDKILASRFQQLIDRERLDDYEHGLGANDLLQVWRGGEFSSLDDLIQSVEHMAFHIRHTKAGEGIKNPRAWILKALKAGYYPPPAGFKSWEARQEEIKLQAAIARQEEVHALRRKRFEVEFDIWLSTLDDERKKSLLSGSNAKPDSRVARAIFRDAFAKESGLEPSPGATAGSS